MSSCSSPGWEIGTLPDGMFELHEGWANGPSFRELDWYSNGQRVAELSIAGGFPDLIDPQTTGDQSLTITDVAGVDALAVENAGLGGPAITLVMWSPQPEVVVYFGMRSPIADALHVARSLHSVDVASWESASRAPSNPPDGCIGFRC